MNEEPDRTIGGLRPRPAFDARTLIKSQRSDSGPVQEPGPPSDSKQVVERKKKAPKKAAVPVPDSPQTPITVYVPQSLRTRARALYRATSHLEGDRTFSHMVEKMLDAAISERELRHNDGQPFAGDTEPLRAGRPLRGD